MVTIQSQNFGVEIEMTGVSRGTAASVIANYFGVGGIHFAGGTYQTYEAKDSKGRVWKCMRDGSITPRRRIGGAIVEADDTYRCEVVTPILPVRGHHRPARGHPGTGQEGCHGEQLLWYPRPR